MKKVVVSWSGGKDSMMVVHKLSQQPDVEIAGLMSAFRGPAEVIGLHNTPSSLIKAQADALKLPLYPVRLSAQAANEEYEQAHIACFEELKESGIQAVAFGDIHLEPIKAYREQLLEKSAMQGNFPLWQRNPQELLNEFLAAGYSSQIIAIDQLTAPQELLGEILKGSIAEKLEKQGQDPCGENGEYHSFVYNGPLFSHAVEAGIGGYETIDYRPEVTMVLQMAKMNPF